MAPHADVDSRSGESHFIPANPALGVPTQPRGEAGHQQPTREQIEVIAARLPEAQALSVLDIDEHAVRVAGLPAEQPRYYLQHALGYQVHDVRHPHRTRRHGRADIGWTQKP